MNNEVGAKAKRLMIGERSEPLSDKLGGEICFATRALVCIYYPFHLQMVVILQPASRRPVSMLTIFTVVIMNNCQQDAKSSYFLPF